MSMKKIIAYGFAVAISLGVAMCAPVQAYGETKYEYEDNNSYATANIVNLDESISGNISEAQDVDYYMFSPYSDGKIELDFCHNYEDKVCGWDIYVYVNDNGQYSELSSTYVALKEKEAVSLPYIGAVQGRTYYVKVKRTGYSGSEGKEYILKTKFIQSNNYEKELNNDFNSATAIALNNSYSGNISESYDEDYYKIVAPDTGKIDIDMLHTYEDAICGWDVYVYVNDNGLYSELSSTYISLKSNEKTSLPYIGAVRGRTYYIKVKRTGYSGSEGREYTIRTTFTESNSYEKELNDDFNSATIINLNDFCSGNISKAGDKDYYKFVAPDTGRITIDILHTYEDAICGWDIYVYLYDNGQYSELSSTYISLNANEKITLPYIGAISGKVYYIKVVRTGYSGSEGKDYLIKTKFYLNAPSYCDAKENKNTAKLTWSKVRGVDGYEIYYKVAGGKYKKLETMTKNAYSYKKLEKGKNYYFKVRAYKKTENKTYYSLFTSSRQVKRK